jgi:hypothetical protein
VLQAFEGVLLPGEAHAFIQLILSAQHALPQATDSSLWTAPICSGCVLLVQLNCGPQSHPVSPHPALQLTPISRQTAALGA